LRSQKRIIKIGEYLAEYGLLFGANAMLPKQDEIAIVKRHRDSRAIVSIPGRFSHACSIAPDHKPARNSKVSFVRPCDLTQRLSRLERLAHAP
jgi:hypothetical protein